MSKIDEAKVKEILEKYGTFRKAYLPEKEAGIANDNLAWEICQLFQDEPTDTCPECKGEKTILYPRYDGVDSSIYTPCPVCHGTGKVSSKPKYGSADCPVYLESQGKKYSPYVLLNPELCQSCPRKNCSSRIEPQPDAGELLTREEASVICEVPLHDPKFDPEIKALWWDRTKTLLQAQHDLDDKRYEDTLTIAYMKGVADTKDRFKGFKDKRFEAKVASAKREERERVMLMAETAAPGLLESYWWQSLKGEGG